MRRLSAFHCLAPDFPGCGMSHRLSWTSVVDAADYAAELIASRVPAGRAHIVGISLGGAVAHTLLARHAGRLNRVIVDGAGVLPWWGNGAYLAFIAAIAPFLHTRAVIAALSQSVGGIPEPDRAEFKRASRLAFLEVVGGRAGNQGDLDRSPGRMPNTTCGGRKGECRSTQQRCACCSHARSDRALCRRAGPRVARQEDGAPPRHGRSVAYDRRTRGRAGCREAIASSSWRVAGRAARCRLIDPVASLTADRWVPPAAGAELASRA